MFSHTVKYKTFEGKDVKKTLYFHLSESDIFRLLTKYPDGPESIGKELAEISASGDNEKLFAEFEKYIFLSYGDRLDDETFDKSEDVVRRFRASLAYNAFFLDITNDSDLAANFITGMFPDEIQKDAKEELLKLKMQQQLGIKKDVSEKTTAELAAEAAAVPVNDEVL